MPPAVPQNDPQLVERLKAGDPAAFDEVVRTHHGVVFRLCDRMLRNRDDAQEATQDTFLAAYQGLGGFGERAQLRTWLLSIAFRKATDRLRQRRNTMESLDDQGEEGVWQHASAMQNFTEWRASPEDTFQRAEIREALSAALERVPPSARAVFELRDMQELSFEETAQILGITEGTARVRLHRVRQALMVELQIRFGRPSETQP